MGNIPSSKGCYLLHFNHPISTSHSAQHYLGFADDIQARILRHRAGGGATLTRVAKERGISFHVARLWPNTDRAFERKLKTQKNSPKFCPICKAAKNEAALRQMVDCDLKTLAD